jgi:colanic acid/amylovoran biosynthesis glycosyltransferase
MALRNMGVIGGKLLTAFHGYDVSRYLREAGPEVYDRLFEEGDLMLPISHYWKDKLIELGCDPRKIGVHRMGVDTGRFAFTPRTLPAEGPLRLVTVARLIDKKGVEYAIRAVAAYAEQGGEVEYTIIGDGPLAPALSRMVRELGMESHIRLTGAMERPGVFATLNRSHVLLAPSVTSADGNQEGIPVAIMEGMATGIPVISTYHTGIPELVEDGVTGMLVPERDPAAIVASLTRLADDPEMYVRVAAAGRERVEQEFDIHRLNDRLVDVYRAVLAGVPPAIQGGGTETRAETRTAAGVRHRDPGHGTPRQEASAPAAP